MPLIKFNKQISNGSILVFSSSQAIWGVTKQFDKLNNELSLFTNGSGLLTSIALIFFIKITILTYNWKS